MLAKGDTIMRMIDCRRDISYEIMRTVACIAVIAIHVFAGYFQMFGRINLSSWIYSDLIDSLSRFSVPLFVMITGALLLKKNIGIKDALHRFIHIFFILIAWSAAYLVIVNIFINGQHYTILSVINQFTGNQIYYHLWYLYMLLGLYLVMPILSYFLVPYRKNVMKYYIYLFAIYTLLSEVLSVLQLLNIHFSFYYTIPMMDWQLGVLIFGYFLSQKVKVEKKEFWVSISVLAVCQILTILLTYFQCAKLQAYNETFYGYNSFTVFIPAAAIFIIIRYLSQKIKYDSWYVKIFRFIGAISLEIYLIHPMILAAYDKYLLKHQNEIIKRMSLQYTFKFMVVCIVSVIAAFIVRYVCDILKRIGKSPRKRNAA